MTLLGFGPLDPSVGLGSQREVTFLNQGVLDDSLILSTA